MAAEEKDLFIDEDEDVVQLRKYRAMWKAESRPSPVYKKIVGGFRIGMPGISYTYLWVVNHRKDVRHGVVGRRVGMGSYGKSLLQSMFKNW